MGLAHDFHFGNNMAVKPGQNLKALRQARELTMQQLADAIGSSPSQIARLESGERRMTAQWMERLGRALGCDPSTLLTGEQQPAAKSGRLSLVRSIPEIDVRAGMGGGGEATVTYVPDGNGGMMAADDVRGQWSLPDDYLAELHVDAGITRIIEVQGDSMEPTLRAGDRVMVDMRAKAPSPPGVFALWDGFGVVVKRIEHVPNTDPPLLKIKSDNALHSEYERTMEEVNIIGRIVWYARSM